NPAWWPYSGWRGHRGLEFDVGIFIEVERDQFAVVFAKGEAIEPELVVLAVGVPTAGLLLAVVDDGAADVAGPGVIPGGDLLGDTNPGAFGQLHCDGLFHEAGQSKRGEGKGKGRTQT